MPEFDIGDSFTKYTREYDVTRTITGMENGGMYMIYTTSYLKKGKEYKPPVHNGRLSIESFADWAYRADTSTRVRPLKEVVV